MTRLLAIFLSIACSNAVLGALHIRDLDDNWSNGHEGVYDDVLDITWLADANLAATETFGMGRISPEFGIGSNVVGESGRMTWNNISTWLNRMNSHDSGNGYFGINTWRLPTAAPLNGVSHDITFSQLGDTNHGYNLSAPDFISSGFKGSEFAHLFYNTIEAISPFNADGSHNSPSEYGLENGANNQLLNLFFNIDFEGVGTYWTGSQITGTHYVAAFAPDSVGQGYRPTNSDYYLYAWTLTDGDVGTAVIPLPATVWLFLSAISCTFIIKRKFV